MSARRRQQQTRQEVDWDFFSFPTFVGFVGGVFLTCLLIAFDVGGFLGGVHTLLWYVSLIGISFTLAHITTRFMARRRQGRRRDRSEEEERERRALAARARAAELAEAGSAAAPRRKRRRRA